MMKCECLWSDSGSAKAPVTHCQLCCLSAVFIYGLLILVSNNNNYLRRLICGNGLISILKMRHYVYFVNWYSVFVQCVLYYLDAYLIELL